MTEKRRKTTKENKTNRKGGHLDTGTGAFWGIASCVFGSNLESIYYVYIGNNVWTGG